MNLKNKLLGANPNESTPLSRAIFFIIIGVAFYLLDRYSLFMIDDYDYAFKFGTMDRIQTLRDIFVSQCDHYMLRNGRFLVHCVVQLFCGILGVEIFRIFNTIMFVLFCAMTTRLVCGTKRASIMWYVVAAFAIWLFIPRIGFTVLGNIACGVNYLWVGVATIFFILLYHKVEYKQYSTIANVGLCIVGAIIGSLQESFSIPVSGALFVYYCFNFKKFKGSVAWLVCGYWLGAIVLVLAPGNFVRLQKEVSSESIIIVSIRRFLAVFGSYWLLIVAFVAHIAMWIRNRVQMRQFILQNVISYAMLLIGLVFTIVIAYTGEHQLFYIGWLVILILLKLVYSYCLNINMKTQRAIIALVILCMLPMYGYAYKYRSEDYALREQLIQSIKVSKDGNIVSGDWYANEVNKSILGKIYSPSANFEPKKPVTSMYYTGDVAHLGNYIPCSLDKLESLLIDSAAISPNVWYIDEYYCYVVKISNEVPIDQVKIEATYPISGLSGIKRRLMNQPLSISYILTEKEVRDVVQYGDSQYAFIWHPLSGKILNLRVVE